MNLDTKDKEKIKANFETGAQEFDRIYEPSDEKSIISKWLDNLFRKTMYIRFEETIKNINKKDIQSVLDVGCGSGRYCLEYLKMGKKVVGIDMASNMLSMAEKICMGTFPNGEINFVHGDYMKHKFDEKFDAAVLMGLFDYIKDSESLLEKLKTDVKGIVLASFPRSDNFLNQIRKIRYLFKNCPLYFYSKKQLEGIFNSIGIQDYSIRETDREYYVSLKL